MQVVTAGLRVLEQLDAAASGVDDDYTGMTLSVKLTSGAWESCIISSYLAAKRRALVLPLLSLLSYPPGPARGTAEPGRGWQPRWQGRCNRRWHA